MKSLKNRLWGAICILVILGLLAACAPAPATATEAEAPAPQEPTAPPETIFVEITSTPQPGAV